MSNIDLTTRIFALSRENELLRTQLQDFRDRFERLTPEGKRRAASLQSILLLLMHCQGVADFQVTQDQIGSVPPDAVLVFGGGENEQTLRVRLLPQAEAEKVVNGHILN